ncbi:MAG: hypothetical protein NC098_05330 [Lachnoclostridium sp.]|nr:hypothetical protein [Lachnoclostridium sp.]
MKNLLNLILVVAMTLATSGVAQAERYVLSDTKYDWSGLANSITSASKSDYEKAHDIYTWLTNNIAYDVTYSIHYADQTYENKRGVCQGYCELFARLGEAVGLRSEVVCGKSKDRDGKIGDIGHAWLFVYTNGNSGIFVDPTWGAGAVTDGRFEKSPNEDWFHVDPAWMIFSHYPDDEMFQLLESKIDYSTFTRLPSFRPELAKMGYKADEFLSKSLSGKAPEIPEFYSSVYNEHARAIKVPQDAVLHIGTEYEFYAVPNGSSRFAIINEGRFEEDWLPAGDYKGVRFMPSKPGTLRLSAKSSGDSWYTIAEYKVAAPTAAETARLEEKYPYLSKCFEDMADCNLHNYKALGVDGTRVLKAIKSENIKRLPTLYETMGCRPVDVPWNGQLTAGKSYRFVLYPGSAQKFAVVNDGNWMTDWTVDPTTGNIIMTIEAATPGDLNVYATGETEDNYHGVLKYTVK